MATPNFHEQITRRRKWTTGVLAGVLGVTLLTLAGATWWRSAHKESAVLVPQALPSNIHQQLSGYSFTRSEEGRRIFTVHAARTVAFKRGGATVLDDVFLEVFGRTGNRRDVMRTRQCEYNAQSGDLFSAGPVRFELNAQSSVVPGAGPRGRQSILLETSKVSFQQQGSMGVTDEPVKFRIGPATGSARGLTYATREGWLELRRDVVVELRTPGAPAADQLIRLTANRLRFNKENGEVTIAGPVEITQGPRRVQADGGTIFLDAQNRVTQTALEGNVRALDSSGGRTLEGTAGRAQAEFDPASGELQSIVAEKGVQAESRRGGNISRLVADHWDVAFAGSHPRPKGGNASGNVELALDSSAGAAPNAAADGRSSTERKTLEAAGVRFTLGRGGSNLEEIQTVGPGKLAVFPGKSNVGRREVTAREMVMNFDRRSRLETLRGVSGVRILFYRAVEGPPGAPARAVHEPPLPPESSSERMEATFDPATQRLRQIEQIGDFRFRDDDRQASADRAAYLAETEMITLVGQPRAWDPTTRMRADRLVLDLRSDTAEGVGKVQSTHFEAASPANPGDRDVPRSKLSDPTNVLADRMLAERRAQFAHYEGHVRAWHGSDVIESSSLDVYRAERRLRSGSEVLTSHLQPAALVPGKGEPSGAERETRPVTIRADRLEYFDEGRKAGYRGNVQLQTENTTLRADRLDVYFSGSKTVEASGIERAVAEGRVTVLQPTRRATGEHAEYYAAAGKILLTGGPPTLEDAEKGSTTGQRLTFFIHDDRLLVDGGDESPTVSRHRVAQ